LDCEESWVPKNWCFWTVVLEKTLESPLDCKEIQPVHSEGDQPWDFFGMNNAISRNMVGPRDDHTKWSKLEKDKYLILLSNDLISGYRRSLGEKLHPRACFLQLNFIPICTEPRGGQWRERCAAISRPRQLILIHSKSKCNGFGIGTNSNFEQSQRTETIWPCNPTPGHISGKKTWSEKIHALQGSLQQ